MRLVFWTVSTRVKKTYVYCVREISRRLEIMVERNHAPTSTQSEYSGTLRNFLLQFFFFLQPIYPSMNVLTQPFYC